MHGLPVISQAEFDALPVVDGYKICPEWTNYCNIKVFGSKCIFGIGSYFHDGSVFGIRCYFKERCQFGNYCQFGEGCYFGSRSYFGIECVFGINCTFRVGCEFAEGCKLAKKCAISSILLAEKGIPHVTVCADRIYRIGGIEYRNLYFWPCEGGNFFQIGEGLGEEEIILGKNKSRFDRFMGYDMGSVAYSFYQKGYEFLKTLYLSRQKDC